jgi:hypothetical protein
MRETGVHVLQRGTAPTRGNTRHDTRHDTRRHLLQHALLADDVVVLLAQHEAALVHLLQRVRLATRLVPHEEHATERANAQHAQTREVLQAKRGRGASGARANGTRATGFCSSCRRCGRQATGHG